MAGENIEGDSLASVMDPEWQIVASVPAAYRAKGLEIWQGKAKLFSTVSEVFADRRSNCQARAA